MHQEAEQEAMLADDDPRPIVGVMAHAYANPLINSAHHALEDDSNDDNDADGSNAREAAGVAAAAAANELVIDALLGAESETIGPQVRFLGLPRGAKFPAKKASGGAWRGPDGLRVIESALPEGLVKKGWLHKHTRELPGSLVYLASVDVSAAAHDWADTENDIVEDLRGVLADLGAREVKVCGGVLDLLLWSGDGGGGWD